VSDERDTDARALGLAAVATTVLLWGLSAVAIKAVSTTGLVTTMYRLAFASPVLLASLATASVRRRLDRDWARACVIGGLLFSLHQMLYFQSLKLTTVTNVTIIGALQPALVLLLSGPLFGETAAPGSLAWSALALVGTGLVVLGSSHGGSSSIAGDAMAFVNLFAFTAYFLASKRFRERIHAWDYVAGMTIVAGVVVTSITLASHPDFGRPRPWEWVTLAWLALLPGTLGHVLTNWAHAHVPAFVSSMILLAVPIVAAAGAHVLLGEVLSPVQLAGGAIVLLSIAAIIRSAPGSEREVLAEATQFTEAP
jgi:drug/metabolite transporter (DMT)-like permease